MPPTDRLLRASGAVFAFSAMGAVVLMAMSPLPGEKVRVASAPAVAEGDTVKRVAHAAQSRPKANAIARPAMRDSRPRLQCAIYARQRSGLALNGAARSWWAKAEGRYRRSHEPEVGSVIVMDGTRSGHVGVVAQVLSDRQILIDHANWENRGEVSTGALVEDVSEANDWSAVRVWHAPSHAMGVRTYPVLGFIHDDAPDQDVAAMEEAATY